MNRWDDLTDDQRAFIAVWALIFAVLGILFPLVEAGIL